MMDGINYYEGAIVDNTDWKKRIVILTDGEEHYKQAFFVQDEDYELIERTQLMRSIGIPTY